MIYLTYEQVILYHIARNHPFCDGNKRTASATALAFLRANGEDPRYEIEDFLKLVVSSVKRFLMQVRNVRLYGAVRRYNFVFHEANIIKYI